MTKTLIALFESTNETMRAEKVLKMEGLKIRAVIKPRKITGNCQTALSFPRDKLGIVKMVIDKESLKLNGFFMQMESGDWAKEE